MISNDGKFSSREMLVKLFYTLHYGESFLVDLRVIALSANQYS